MSRLQQESFTRKRSDRSSWLQRQHTTLKFPPNKNVTAFNIFVLLTISQSLIAKALSIQSNKDQNLEIYYENTGNSDKSYPTERRQEDLP